MKDLIVAIGLVFVIEGGLYALFPHSMQKMMRLAIDASPESLRIMGLVGACLGVVIVWLMRG